MDKIFIKKAAEHNLKNIDVSIPRNKLVVITGLSGSGKSSLAFDTLYAEGQRRYVESLSAYARQFLEQMQKPKVEYIEGLSPAISIEQRVSSSNPRSTVGTQTEIYDYLRLLYARAGTPYCFKCGRKIESLTVEDIIRNILNIAENKTIYIYAPVIKGKKGEHKELLKQIRKQGFIKIKIDNELLDINEDVALNKNKKHSISILVDRFKVSKENKIRLVDSVETALKAGNKTIFVEVENSKQLIYSTERGCVHCGIGLGELNPRNFSFNSPYGACNSCNGLGTKLEIDPDLVVPDKTKSINQGAIKPWRRGGRRLLIYYNGLSSELAYSYDINLDALFKDLNKKSKDIILYGSNSFEGVIPNLERRFIETKSDYVKNEINRYMSMLPCPDCKGQRLKPESLAVKINDKNIYELTEMSIYELKDFLSKLKLEKEKRKISSQILKEINSRLDFMIDVGLSYLSLNRKSETLSGGESERIRLATQIGSGLVGVLYVLDEPSIGLHQKDISKLLNTLNRLRDLGNTVVIIEHDESTIRKADYIIDLGPGAGKNGGHVVAEGNVKDIINNSNSLTGKYLKRELKIALPAKYRKVDVKDNAIKIIGAEENNLRKINVTIPLGCFICVTGVSGSGKSTLVNEVFYKVLANKLYNSKFKPGKHKDIKGIEKIKNVVVVDQSPIGRTPRSNPATYTGVFTYIRDLFSRVPESRIRGYKPGRFSFNVKEGRCQACNGDGVKKIEMHFLPDVYVTCQACKGTRYNEATLQIKYKGYNIAEVLNMTIEEARGLFCNVPAIKNKLDLLIDVGLGYMQLGQPATTLSGGEAQRIKLSRELSKRGRKKYLYILDEPTTGLHFADIDKLLSVIQSLVDSGNTVLVIEHNLDVIKCSDYIIDLGPEGGDNGGKVIFQGETKEIVKIKSSYTGKYLNEKL